MFNIKYYFLAAATLAASWSMHVNALSEYIWNDGTIHYRLREENVKDGEYVNLPLDSEWVKYDLEKNSINLGNNNALVFNSEADNIIVTATIVDSGNNGGGIIARGPGITILKGDNTYRGGTLIDGGNLCISDDKNLGALETPVYFTEGAIGFFKDDHHPLNINREAIVLNGTKPVFCVLSDSTVYWNGPISGASNGILKTGPGTFALSVPNNYTGTTVIQEGALLVNSYTLPANVENHATLSFLQTLHGTYDGQISGDGVVKISGPGTLKLTADSSAFQGHTFVEGGNLCLENTLGGNVFINSSKLTGAGIILGDLVIGPRSTIDPGKNVETVTVIRNYTQHANANYIVQFNGAGESTLLDITGQAFLGGNVIVSSADGTHDIGTTYTILEANAGIIDQFSGVSPLITNDIPVLYIPILSYDLNHVFLNLKTNIYSITKTFNQREVAHQLDSIVDPTPSQLIILNKMIGLSPVHARHALNQMSGQQHTADILQSELLNRQFIRRLFDPLRSIVGSDPCIREWYELENCCNPCGVDAWFEGSGSYTSQKGGSNTTGFKVDGGEITLGAQKTFDNDVTAGIAGAYEYDQITYHLGGTGSMNSFIGGVYGLYRPARFYILSDLAFSYSFNQMKRPIEMGTLKYHAKSTPNMAQVTSYSEFGVDFLWEDLLIQPFLGVEAAHYWRNRVKEHGAGDLNLTVKSRKYTSVNSRLGVHLNAPNLPTDFNLYIDLAWLYRWTDHSNFLSVHYETFGTDMCVEGLPLYHNCFEGTLAFTKEICDCWEFFAEFSGQFWKRSTSYYILGGVECQW